MIPRSLKKSYRTGGFTLLEILIALAVMVILGGILYPSLMAEIHFSNRSTTRARLATLRRAVTQAYTQDAMVIDTLPAGSTTTPTITFDETSTETLATGNAAPPGNPSLYQSGMAVLAQYANMSTPQLVQDGFGRPWQVFVSDPLIDTYQGVTLTYHDIAFVSNDGGPETASGQTLNAQTAFDPATGILTLGGHDVGVVIDGDTVERALLQKTLRRMRLVANEYATFFLSQYESNPNRDISVDYFASAPPNGANAASWDAASPILNSANGNGPGYAFPGNNATGALAGPSLCDVQPATTTAFQTTLGLSTTDVTSAWGYPLGFGNGPNAGSSGGTCYGDDRDPNSSNGALQAPPYTALILAWVPGQNIVTVPVIGGY